MDKFKNFLGIDVSKEFFDAVIILNSDKNTAVHEQFTNNSDGLKQMFKWLKSHKAYATDHGIRIRAFAFKSGVLILCKYRY